MIHKPVRATFRCLTKWFLKCGYEQKWSFRTLVHIVWLDFGLPSENNFIATSQAAVEGCLSVNNNSRLTVYYGLSLSFLTLSFAFGLSLAETFRDYCLLISPHSLSLFFSLFKVLAQACPGSPLPNLAPLFTSQLAEGNHFFIPY